MGDYKAVSQNLMHRDIRVTDAIYAPLLGNEISTRIRSLSIHPLVGGGIEGELSVVLEKLSRKDRQQALIVLANSMSD